KAQADVLVLALLDEDIVQIGRRQRLFEGFLQLVFGHRPDGMISAERCPSSTTSGAATTPISANSSRGSSAPSAPASCIAILRRGGGRPRGLSRGGTSAGLSTPASPRRRNAARPCVTSYWSCASRDTSAACGAPRTIRSPGSSPIRR